MNVYHDNNNSIWGSAELNYKDDFDFNMISNNHIGSALSNIGINYSTPNSATKNHGWIKNGTNDQVPLIKELLFKNSSIHNTSIDIKKNLCIGNGINIDFHDFTTSFNKFGQIEYKPFNLTDKQKKEEIYKTRAILDNINIDKYLEDASEQYFIQGEVFYYNKFRYDSLANIYLESVLVENSTNCRIARPNYVNGETNSTSIYLSQNWQTANIKKLHNYNLYLQKKDKIHGIMTKLPILSSQNIRNKYPIYMGHVRRSSAIRNFYGTADYETNDAINYIIIDYLLSIMDKNNIENGFQIDYIFIRYRRKQTTEKLENEAKENDLKMLKRTKGVQADKSLVLWADPIITDKGVESPKVLDVIPIPNNNNTSSSDQVRKERLSNILNAHKIMTPELIGHPPISPSGFSSQGDYIVTAQKHLQAVSIDPAQKTIIKPIQDIIRLMGLSTKLSIIPKKIHHKDVDSNILADNFLNEEIRGIYGYSPLSQEQLERLNKNGL